MVFVVSSLGQTAETSNHDVCHMVYICHAAKNINLAGCRCYSQDVYNSFIADTYAQVFPLIWSESWLVE